MNCLRCGSRSITFLEIDPTTYQAELVCLSCGYRTTAYEPTLPLVADCDLPVLDRVGDRAEYILALRDSGMSNRQIGRLLSTNENGISAMLQQVKRRRARAAS